MAIATGETILAADVLALLPENIIIFPAAYRTIEQGTWVQSAGGDSYFGGWFHNSSEDDADEITITFNIKAGTYAIDFYGKRVNDAGVLDIDIDAGEVASFDLYNADSEDYTTSDAGNVIATGGEKTLTLRADGKNGSSSDYHLYIGAIILRRTA